MTESGSEYKVKGRGGKREGAGRPTFGDRPKQSMTIRLDQNLVKILKTQPNYNALISKLIEDWASQNQL